MRTPPLKALHAFCVFGSTVSVQATAEELGVSSSAVSQQLKNLEEWLGISLISRSSGSMELTPNGRAYYNEVWQAFSIISDATESLRGTESQGNLVISVLPSFATLWLLPRMSEFQEQFPDTKITVQTTNNLETFDGTDLNLAVRFGKGRYQGMRSVEILPEYSNLVCSPATYKKFFGQENNPTASPLEELPFIDDRGVPNINSSLSDWMVASGRSPLEPKFVGTFSDSQLAVANVIEQNNFLLARYCIVEEMLNNGDLIAPFGGWIKEPASYFVVYPMHRPLRPVDKNFLKWLTRISSTFKKSMSGL
jgi:LysR family glycine cleavage system transcriptional activator